MYRGGLLIRCFDFMTVLLFLQKIVASSVLSCKKLIWGNFIKDTYGIAKCWLSVPVPLLPLKRAKSVYSLSFSSLFTLKAVHLVRTGTVIDHNLTRVLSWIICDAAREPSMGGVLKLSVQILWLSGASQLLVKRLRHQSLRPEKW